ncbi:MAG: hypothetical protein WBD40_12930 [Tepidisphaeraceae bacterium]
MAQTASASDAIRAILVSLLALAWCGCARTVARPSQESALRVAVEIEHPRERRGSHASPDLPAFVGDDNREDGDIPLLLSDGTGPYSFPLGKLSKFIRYVSLAQDAGDGRDPVKVLRAEQADYDLRPLNAPFESHTHIAQVRTGRPVRYARFFTDFVDESSPVGRWMTPVEDVEGMKPAAIQQSLGMKHLPSHRIDVNVPAGVRIRIGEVAPQADWGVRGGGTQVQLVDAIPDSAFDVAGATRVEP